MDPPRDPPPWVVLLCLLVFGLFALWWNDLQKAPYRPPAGQSSSLAQTDSARSQERAIFAWSLGGFACLAVAYCAWDFLDRHLRRADRDSDRVLPPS